MGQYYLRDLNKSAMNGLSKPQQAERLLVYLLQSNSSYSITSALEWKTLCNKYSDLKSKHKDIVSISDSSLYQYALSFVKDPDSPICQAGYGKGFYLDHMIISNSSGNNSIADSSPDPAPNETKYLEKEMYPILVDWLKMNLSRANNQHLYGVQNISSRRGMDKWSNPDILGVVKCNYFGNLSLELVTLEAKRDSRSWRTDIFEAVAHTVIANRSYYVYLKKKGAKLEDEKDLVSYAQKFGIGVLAMIIPDDKWGEKLSYEMIEDFDILVPAPYHQPQVQMQKKFLSSLDIKEPDDIDKFINA